MFTVRIGENDYVAYEKNTIQEWYDENRMSADHMLFNHLNGQWGTVGEFLGLDNPSNSQQEAEWKGVVQDEELNPEQKNDETTDNLEHSDGTESENETEPTRTLESMTKDTSRMRALKLEKTLAYLGISGTHEEIVKRYAKKVMALRFFSNVVLMLFLLWGWGTAISLYSATIGQLVGIGVISALFGGIAFALLRGLATAIELLLMLLDEKNENDPISSWE